METILAESVISSVNWALVIQKAIAWDVVVDGMLDDMQALELVVEPFTPQAGEVALRL